VAPANVRIDSPDPSHVRITWQSPNTAAWNCNSGEIEIDVVQPVGRAPIRVPIERTSTIIETASNEEWVIRARLVTSAGPGPWSPSVTGTTSAPQELVVNVRVTYTRDTAVLHWQSIEIQQEALVSHYEVEYSLDGRNWRTHRNSRVSSFACLAFLHPSPFPCARASAHA